MITRLRLQNFKGFQKFDLSDWGRVTLIGGPNNIGKTSLLEAIFFFYDRGNPNIFFRHLTWRGMQVTAADRDTLFAPIFYDFNMDQHLVIEVNDSIYHSRLDVSLQPISETASASINLSEINNSSPQIDFDSLVSNSYNFNLRYEVDGIGKEDVSLVIKQTPTNVNIQLEPRAPGKTIPVDLRRTANFLPLQIRTDPQEDAIRFGKLDIERSNHRVLEFLQILEPRLVGLTSITQQPRSEIYADLKGMARKIPVTLLGEGMSRLLSIILAIASSRNGIVLIDEIDAGLHHSVLAKIWQGIFQAAQEYQCQIITTTHSYECLQAAYDGASMANTTSELRYIRLEKIGDKVVGKTYRHEVLGAALSQGWEVR